MDWHPLPAAEGQSLAKVTKKRLRFRLALLERNVVVADQAAAGKITQASCQKVPSGRPTLTFEFDTPAEMK
jgi:hypothetical protein